MINKIEEWGKWARHHKDDLGSQSAWLSVMRDNVQMHKGVRYCITDEQALAVDEAVCKLYRYSPALGNVLTLRFLFDVRPVEISQNYAVARNGGYVSKDKVYQMLAEAQGFVMGALIDYED
ncbi:hypothetical protein KZX29_00935 [Moraxella osloensis]|uniref:antiterminator Q family protein n=1 Tax=Faucicola osloensis TaxID=34062 RepID=UPI002004E4B2|nr:antiterminator Q family protein [Moraxella osloensis]MCK6157368.1 hypothetical protein [Moraxella osloensis]